MARPCLHGAAGLASRKDKARTSSQVNNGAISKLLSVTRPGKGRVQLREERAQEGDTAASGWRARFSKTVKLNRTESRGAEGGGRALSTSQQGIQHRLRFREEETPTRSKEAVAEHTAPERSSDETRKETQAGETPRHL